MTKYFLFTLLFIWPFLAFAQGQIIGRAPNIKDGTEIVMSRFLPKFSDTTINKITTTVQNHTFYFPKDIDHTELYLFKALGKSQSFFLDKGSVEITIPDQSIENAIIIKSNSEEDSQRYLNLPRSKASIAYGKAATAFDSFLKSNSKDITLRNKLRNNVDSTKREYEQAKAKNDLHWINQKQNFNN